MPDPASNFFQTLVALASEATQVLVGNTTFLENVFTDYQPVVATPGETLNVLVPNSVSASVTDIGTGPFVLNNIGTSTTPMVFNNHPAFSYNIADFSQFNSPEMLRELFVDPGIKGIAEYVNSKVAALFTPANFNAAPPVVSAASGVLQVSDATSARTILSTAKVPVRDFPNMFLTTSPAVYGGMLNNTNWTANSQVGFQLAGQIRQQALLGQQLGAVTSEDQAMPYQASVNLAGGTVTFTNGSPNITNTSSLFASLVPGQWIQLSTDVTNTLYQIKTITSNNAAVLATDYTGVTGTATAQITSYTSALYHRYAVALGLRLLPPPDPQVTKSAIVFYKKLPIFITLAYIAQNRGYMLAFDTAYATQVVRPNMGQIILS